MGTTVVRTHHFIVFVFNNMAMPNSAAKYRTTQLGAQRYLVRWSTLLGDYFFKGL